ncbi:hypothetical protein [Pseudolysinimonas sp.]|jgi:hypothetical protein|uniref:hypothetical protein n=1 Tax=Pseudolysinimonas sp. TaxID=2680009 RepID=UPI0037834836
MKEHLNGDTTFATLLMLRSGTAKLVLVVEGADDAMLLRDHLSDQIQLLVAVGRRNSLEAAQLVEREGLPGTRFIIDRDLDGLFGLPDVYPACVIATQGPDLLSEILNLSPRILTRVVEVHARSTLRRNAGISAEQMVAEGEAISRRLVPVRAASILNGIPVRFRDFPFDTLIAAGGLEAGHADIIRAALKRSNTTVAQTELEQLVAAVSVLEDLDTLTPGDHDRLRAIASVMRFRGVSGVTVDVLVGSVFLLVDCSVIGAAPAVRAFQEWATGFGVEALNCDQQRAA